MNKLFTKIVGAALGLAMTIGVGVMVGNNTNESAVVHAANPGSSIYTSGTPSWGTSYAYGSSDSTKLNNVQWYVTTYGNNTSIGWNNASQNKSSSADFGPLTFSANNKSGMYQTGNDFSNAQKITITISNLDQKTGTWYIYYSTNSGTSWTQATSGSLAANTTSLTYDKGSKIGDSVRFAFGFGFTSTATNKFRVNLSGIQVWQAAAQDKEADTMTIAPSSLTVYAGEQGSFTPSLSGGTGTYEETIGWVSNKPDIITSPQDSEAGTAVNITPNSVQSNTDVTITGTVKVTNGASASIVVTVKPARTLESIAVLTPPTKTTYGASEFFDPTGLIIRLTYDDDSKKDVAYVDDSSNFTFSPSLSTALTIADKSVTITYGGKTTVQSITVLQVAVYTATSRTAASTSGTAPANSSITYANTSTSGGSNQMTNGQTGTWTLKGYSGKTITKIVIEARKSNSASGSISVATNNGTSILDDLDKTTFSSSELTSTLSPFTIYSETNPGIDVKGDVVLRFLAGASSFYVDNLTISWVNTDSLSENLIISNPTDNFIVGDTFEIGDTVEAYYSESHEKDVTSDVTLDLTDVGEIHEGDTITGDWVGTKEVGVYYEDAKGNMATASYDITVEYEKVSSVSISKTTPEIGKSGEFTFGATVLPENANPNVTWKATSEDLNEGDDFSINSSTGKLEVDASSGGTITITATTVGKDSSNKSKTASVDVTITGDPVVVVSSALAGYSGKNTNLAYSFSNFTNTLSVVSSDTNTVTVGTPTVTTGSSGNGTVQVNFVAAGTATLTFKNGSSNVGTCAVTVTASAVNSVYWTSVSDMIVYAGSTELNSSKITSWGPKYEMNNGDEGTISSNYSIQLNGTAYTLGSALQAGVYSVSLTYGGQTTSNNPTLTVVQTLNNINGKGQYSWEAGSGDQNIIATAGANGDFEIGGKTWTIERDNTATTNLTSGAIQIGSNGNPTNFSLTTNFGSNKVITKITVQCASYHTDNTSSTGLHDISISVGGITYFSGATPRWANNSTGPVSGTGTSTGDVVITYSANTDARAAYLKSIVVEFSSNLANQDGHEAAQNAVVTFAKAFNTALGGTSYCTTGLSDAWSDASDAWDDFKTTISSLSTAEQTFAKDMIKYAEAKWTENTDNDYAYCLERAMATYEYCVANHDCTPFIKDGETPLRSNLTPTTGFNGLFDSSNQSIIIVMISLISLAGIGVVFYKRKRQSI